MLGEQQQGWGCESVGHYDWPVSAEHDWSHRQCHMCEVSDVIVTMVVTNIVHIIVPGGEAPV